MSYDLYLQPRSGTIPPAAFFSWFADRPFYERRGNEVFYGCEDTGVYFHFVVKEDESGGAHPKPQGAEEEDNCPLEFNMNYFRPSYFASEAEPELTALVKEFDLTVVDYQIGGMESGEYSPEGFLNGWHTGNAFAYSSIIGQYGAENEHWMEQEQLTAIWRWNYKRARSKGTDDQQGVWVPRISFGLSAGKVVTVAVWPDGLPSMLPRTNYVAIGRFSLAPRKWLIFPGRDICWVQWTQVEPLLRKYAIAQPDGSFRYVAKLPDPEIAAFIRSLEPAARPVEAISADKVLDKELVDAALQAKNDGVGMQFLEADPGK